MRRQVGRGVEWGSATWPECEHLSAGGPRVSVVVVALAWALKMEKGFCEAEKVGGGSTGSGENMGMDPRAEEVTDHLSRV